METEQNNDVPMIELYKVESIIVHASEASKNARIISWIAGIVAALAIIANVCIVSIFTHKYNERTNNWLKTVEMLVDRMTITEVSHENNGAEDIQQFAPP